MRLLSAVFSAILAISFSTLAAAAGTSNSANGKAGTSAAAGTSANMKAGAGASADKDKKHSKSTKQSAGKSPAKDKH